MKRVYDIDFVEYQSRGTSGQVSALEGAKSLYGTLLVQEKNLPFIKSIRIKVQFPENKRFF